MSFKIGRALIYAVLLWLIGFIWGSIVFMTPTLKNVSPIPYLSNNPAISFPILLIMLIVIPLLAKNYLKSAADKPDAGMKLGVVFFLVNIALDIVVLLILLKAGSKFFMSLTLWLAYLMLLLIPLIVGRSLQRTSA